MKRFARTRAAGPAALLLVACAGTRLPTAPQGPPVHCGHFGDMGFADSPLPLLGGRLTVLPILHSAAAPFDFNIMAAPPSDEIGMRVRVGFRDERFVIMADELFRTVGGDLARQAATFFERLAAERGVTFRIDPPVGIAGRARAILAWPTQPYREGPATLVVSVVVAQADGTAQWIEFYVVGLAPTAGCGELAARIARTIAPGERRLDRSGGTRRLGRWRDEDVTIALPRGWALVRQPGADFEIAWIYKLTALDERPVRMGIYVGNYPGRLDESVERLAGRLLGHDVTWFVARGEGRVEMNAIAPIIDSAVVHVFFSTVRDADAHELKRVAESLALSPAPNAR